eukprot:3438980-Pleurochrysis_carterae.AAC.1
MVTRQRRAHLRQRARGRSGRAQVRVAIYSFTHPPSPERISLTLSRRSSGGAAGRAARRPAPRLCGVRCIGSTHPTGSGTQSASTLSRAAKQRGCKRSRAPRWSVGGRLPRAPKPRRPSPISTERG